MERWTTVKVIFLTFYFTGTIEQTIYEANNFYKPMTDDYDVRHRGQVFLPPCMKNLMNCWEVVRPDLFCKYARMHRQTLESMCMDLRLQCTDFTGPLPFEVLNVSNWEYCPPTKMQLPTLDFRPNLPSSNKPDSWWWNQLRWHTKDYDKVLGYKLPGRK